MEEVVMKKLWTMVALLAVIAMLASACGPTPEPETIIQTVEVEKEVKVVETVEVEKEVTVIETVEVEKEVEVPVEVEVTAAPAAKPYEGVEINVLTFSAGGLTSPS
jgi:hypothetical protein